MAIKVHTVSPAPLSPPAVINWEDWKGWTKAITLSIFAASFITSGSFVYKLAIKDPKKNNIIPMAAAIIEPILPLVLIYSSAKSGSSAPKLLPVKEEAAIPKACPGVKERLNIFKHIWWVAKATVPKDETILTKIKTPTLKAICSKDAGIPIFTKLYIISLLNLNLFLRFISMIVFFFKICLINSIDATTCEKVVEIPAPLTPNLGKPNSPYISTAFPITFKKFTLIFIS